jgi:hypothetical protein
MDESPFAALMMFLPILPKPLIPTLIAILSFSLLWPAFQTRGLVHF